MKAYVRVDVYIHIFLTSALAGCEWSDSRLGRFTHEEEAPDIHWIGGWVDPRASLDDAKNRKFLTLTGLETRTSVVQPVASRYSDKAIPASYSNIFKKELSSMKSVFNIMYLY
jgi:hypothetical protein